MSSSANDSSRSSSGPGPPSTTTIGLILAVVALILVVVILLATRRFKRKSNKGTSVLPTELVSPRSTVMDRTHPSARITPFGSNHGREIPAHVFDHEPGRNMRIAIRRPDGSWDFVDSRPSSYALVGATDLDSTPASHSSVSLLSFSSHPSCLRSKKEDEAQRWRRKEFDFDVEPHVTAPPPAYGQL